MITIRPMQSDSESDRACVRALLEEYLQWLEAEVEQAFGVAIDSEAMLADYMANLDSFQPPEGALLLAVDGEDAVGMGSLRRITAEMGEIKRMYVRPGYRGRGLGRQLLGGLIDEARERGYAAVRLDSGPFMQSAHGLYRSMGFREIEPFSGTEIPEHLHDQCLFMALDL